MGADTNLHIIYTLYTFYTFYTGGVDTQADQMMSPAPKWALTVSGTPHLTSGWCNAACDLWLYIGKYYSV